MSPGGLGAGAVPYKFLYYGLLHRTHSTWFLPCAVSSHMRSSPSRYSWLSPHGRNHRQPSAWASPFCRQTLKISPPPTPTVADPANGGFRRTADAPDYLYVLGFAPQKLDGKFHNLKVTVSAGGKTTVQQRKRYYAAKVTGP